MIPPDPLSDQPPPAPKGGAFKLAGVLFLVPGIFACPVFFGYVVLWMGAGFHFSQDERVYAPVIVIVLATPVLVSIIALGLLLRFSGWPRAEGISLWLAMAATAIILLTLAMALSAVLPGDSESNIALSALAIAALAVVALPPFLFWRHGRR